MKKCRALRFLLLRHLASYEAKVDPNFIKEVTHSLHVHQNKAGDFIVAWKAFGARHEHVLPQDMFEFYHRGDTNPENRSIDDCMTNENDERAREFASRILKGPGHPAKPTAVRPERVLTLFEYVNPCVLDTKF